MTTKISIVVAAHNEGDSLWKTVRSCVETCGDYDPEIIIADDASSDGSVDEAVRRYPQVRVVRHAERLGPSPTKHLGATAAAGDVLVFLDGHCKPELGAIERLVEDVRLFEGQAIVTPTVPPLDVETWENASGGGHGYQVWLDTLDCGWIPLHEMQRCRREIRGETGTFYESPALIGCAFAISRDLYHKLGGFDVDMRSWGVEDLDFGVTCWLMGHKIVHDPEARVGHRFQKKLDRYPVPPEHMLSNQLRMARKHFGDETWEQWLNHFRSRIAPVSNERRQPLWQAAWRAFEAHRASLEERRALLTAERMYDELWYAEHFRLGWPAHGGTLSAAAASDPEMNGSPPPPCCEVTGLGPAKIVCDPQFVAAYEHVTFTAAGKCHDEGVAWDAGDGLVVDYPTDSSLEVLWETPGTRNVSASCRGTSASVEITVVAVEKIQYRSAEGAWIDATAARLHVLKGATVHFRAVRDPANSVWPDGRPVWGGAASGTGELVSVTFNAIGETTVTAECGLPVVVNITVFELIPKHEPELAADNFSGRSTTAYGILEHVKLSFETDPPGISATDAGNLKWEIGSGGGEMINAGQSGEAVYICPFGAEVSVTVLIATQSGPSHGTARSLQFDVKAPNAGYCERLLNFNIWHRKDTYSIGMRTQFYLTPKDVSFSYLYFTEGDCAATDGGAGFGWWKHLPPTGTPPAYIWSALYLLGHFQLHPEGPDWQWVRMQAPPDSNTGTPVFPPNMWDTAQAGAYQINPPCPPYSAGTFVWDIPWLVGPDDTFPPYQAGSRDFYIYTMEQKFTVDAAGNATVSKGGASGQNNHSNGDQDY